ncbi:hypothetical protein [Polaribacter tangerinus]|uniref:hypothetical protein n=1 Tax=Polaribacter tangerinus TaxID=1920034 RepID=UPI000B4B1877|nr:hypothetical protein [Polaribacter tangerinus]
MKTYNSTNFFKHTFCEFFEVTDFKFPSENSYKSNSNSCYYYTEKGVYRKSNHWGRVANCRWKLIANNTYKNQKMVIGFAKWTDFFDIKSTEKLFFIEVDFDKKSAKIKPNNTNTSTYNYTYKEALKRAKSVKNLFKNERWSQYFSITKEVLYKEVINKYITSDASLKEIKDSVKNQLINEF